MLGIKLVKSKNGNKILPYDNCCKRCILIFFATFFDFIEFIIDTFYLPGEIRFKNISISLSLDTRIKIIIAIFLFLFCYYLLKYKILKHQLFSLLVISICFIIIVISEYFFVYNNNQNIISFSFILFIMFLNHFFISLQDIIEKYLFEYDYLNPFELLIYEGIIGSLLWLIYYLVTYLEFKKDNLEEIKEINYKNMNFGWIIIFFISYFFLSGLKNIYRLLTINIFSPMTRILTDTMMSPILLLYYYFLTEDFEIKKEKKKLLFYYKFNFIFYYCFFWSNI